MREILFRGKRLNNGEWIEGGITSPHPVVRFVSIIEKSLNPSTLPDYILRHRTFLVDPETVGQFTGLYDKNGTKIFEGDIVIHCNENPHGDIEKGQVYWDEGFCGWRRTSNGAFNHGKIDTYRIAPNCVYEVIGNIHDNPELLKGETE